MPTTRAAEMMATVAAMAVLDSAVCPFLVEKEGFEGSGERLGDMPASVLVLGVAVVAAGLGVGDGMEKLVEVESSSSFSEKEGSVAEEIVRMSVGREKKAGRVMLALRDVMPVGM